MRAFVAAAVVASVFNAACGSAFAFDMTGASAQRFTAPAAVAYFRLPFGATKAEDRVAYGLAITAPTLRSTSAAPLPIAEMPKLVDVRFNGALPESLRLTGHVAWAQDPSQYPSEQRANLFGGIMGFALGLALTAGAVYGVYSLVKKNCPAVSTSTGGCVKPAS